MLTDLERMRRDAGLTQGELAELLGVDRSTVAKWETGKSTPRLPTLVEMARLYGCSVEKLIRT